MPVRIRLRRMGRKKQPHYRVVVADSQSPRDGRFVETLGYYKPLSEPARLVLDLERVDHWLGEGADPSATVKSLIAKAKAGGDTTIAVGPEDAEVAKAKRAEELAAKKAADETLAAEKAAEEKAAAEAAVAEAAAAEAAAAEAAKAEAAAAESVAEEAEPAATETEPEAEPEADEKKAE
ncbi:MAG: 30S ribosomal protein S16 [Gemmatimonadota bacterium]